jgi:hypothetical protein
VKEKETPVKKNCQGLVCDFALRLERLRMDIRDLLNSAGEVQDYILDIGKQRD